MAIPNFRSTDSACSTVDQSATVSERAPFAQVVNNFTGALADETGIDGLDSGGDHYVHLLFAQSRDAGK